ncbi:hypothetical protein [Streptosporangium sp. NPDC003464]
MLIRLPGLPRCSTAGGRTGGRGGLPPVPLLPAVRPGSASCPAPGRIRPGAGCGVSGRGELRGLRGASGPDGLPGLSGRADLPEGPDLPVPAGLDGLPEPSERALPVPAGPPDLPEPWAPDLPEPSVRALPEPWAPDLPAPSGRALPGPVGLAWPSEPDGLPEPSGRALPEP